MKEFSLLPARLTPKKFNHVAEHQKLKFFPLFARNVESRKVSPTFLAKLLIYGFFAVKLPTPWTSRIHKVNAKWWLEWQIIFFILSLKDFLPVAIFHLVACKSWRIPRRRQKLLTFITTKLGRVEGGGGEWSALPLLPFFISPENSVCVRWIQLTSSKCYGESYDGDFPCFTLVPFFTFWILRRGWSVI